MGPADQQRAPPGVAGGLPPTPTPCPRSVSATRQPLVRTLVVLWAAVRIGLELWWLERRVARLPPAIAEGRRQAVYAAQATRLRLLMTQLQGLWIKLGQFLSTRADVLPAAYTREFGKLQDLVPSFDAAQARAAIAEAFGRPVDGPGGMFAAFEDNALAAASLGQVHRAWVAPEMLAQATVAAEAAEAAGATASGDGDDRGPAPTAAAHAGTAAASGPEAAHPGATPVDAAAGPGGASPGGAVLVPVAVKVLRPGIERAVAADLSALLWIVRGTDRWTRLGRRTDLFALHREVAQITTQEMDYRIEARHAARFRENLRGQPGLEAPLVYPAWTTRRVIVMQYVTGLRIDRPDDLRAAGIDPKAIALLLGRSYVRQVLRDGFFHADPHPGNMFVTPAGGLIYIDFGMMAEIRPEERTYIAHLIAAAIARDYDGILRAMRDLGFLRPGARAPVLRKALAMALDEMSGVSLERPDTAEFRAFLDEMREFVYTEPFQLPARYAYLGRALGILLGLVTTLDPEIHMLPLMRESALPLLGLDGQGGGGKEQDGGAPGATLLSGLWGGARDTVLALYRLPRRIERLVERMEEGELQVQADVAGLQRRVEGWARATRGLADNVLAGGAAVCATIFTIAHRSGYAKGAWLAAVILLIAGWRSGRRL